MFFTLEPAEFAPNRVANLAAWYAADKTNFITRDSSNDVATWGDLSGNGYDLTAAGAKQPRLVVDQQGGLPSINFDGSHQMVIPSGLFAVPNGASTIFIVSQRASESGSTETIFNLSDSTAADYFIIYSASAGIISFKSRDGAAGTVSSSGNTLTNYNIIRGRRTGTTQAIAVNGSSETTNASGVDSSSIDSGDVGASNNDNLFLNGYIGEIVIYNASLSVANILLVETYLANKWGLALV